MLVRVGLLSLQLGRVFLFCAVVTGVTRPNRPRPYIPRRPTLARSIPNHAQDNAEKQTRQPTRSNAKSSATNWPYTARYAAANGVIHRKGQAMSDLQKSCILCHSQRILIIYRKIKHLYYRRLRKRIVLRSLERCYPQTINSCLYYHTVFMQDSDLYMHYI